MKRFLTLLILVVGASVALMAANSKPECCISGTVYSEKDKPIKGVEIVYKSQTIATSDAKGEFTLNAPSNATLYIYKDKKECFYGGISKLIESFFNKDSIMMYTTDEEGMINTSVPSPYIIINSYTNPLVQEYKETHDKTFSLGDKFPNWEDNYINVAKEQCALIQKMYNQYGEQYEIDEILPLFSEMLSFGFSKDPKFMTQVYTPGFAEKDNDFLNRKAILYTLHQVKDPKLLFYINCYTLTAEVGAHGNVQMIMDYIKTPEASLDEKAFACNTLKNTTDRKYYFNERDTLRKSIIMSPDFSIEKVVASPSCIQAIAGYGSPDRDNQFRSEDIQLMSNIMSKLDLNNQDHKEFIDSYFTLLDYYCCASKRAKAKNFSEEINNIAINIRNQQGEKSPLLIQLAKSVRIDDDSDEYIQFQKKIYTNKEYVTLSKGILDAWGTDIAEADFNFFYNTVMRAFDGMSKSGYAWDYKIFSPLDLMKTKRELIIKEYGKDSEEFSAFLLNDVVSRYGEYSEEYDLLK
ncbi:MAG: hypothetical protein LIP09_15035 [Bacteroidales bacterium]|nr:hypothetical protein [Bacteroidales bacterium]